MKIKILILAIILVSCFFVWNKAYASNLDSLPPEVRIFNSKSFLKINSFLAYHSDFKGGVNVAVGDLDGDGKNEIVVGAGPGGGPHIRVFKLDGRYTGWDVFAFHHDFRGGVEVATGDIDGDGLDEIIAGQESLGEAWVKVYKVNQEKTIIANFRAYEERMECGVSVAAGDINGDGKDEIIVGAGRSGTPEVRVFKIDGTKIWDVWPFHPTFSGGLDLASGDLDGNGIDEIIVSQKRDGEAWLKVYQADAQRTILAYQRVFPQGWEVGARVAAGDINGDGQDEIFVGAGKYGPHVRIFGFRNNIFQLLKTGFFAYDRNYKNGVNVTAGDIDNDGKDEIITGVGTPKIIKDRHVYLDIPYYRQEHSLSCEAAALRMSLAYKGISISEAKIIEEVGFDPTPHQGNLWGNPHQGYVGNIDGVQPITGYGVYWEPIARAARNYRPAIYFSGWNLKKVLQEVADGNPVIIWGSILDYLAPIYWQTPDGRVIYAIRGEHTYVVKGFVGSINNPSRIILNDSLVGERRVSTDWFLKNWGFLGRSGVVVR